MYECDYFKEIRVDESISVFCLVPTMNVARFTQIMDQYSKIYRPCWKYQVDHWHVWDDGSSEILETIHRFIKIYLDICDEHEHNILCNSLKHRIQRAP